MDNEFLIKKIVDDEFKLAGITPLSVQIRTFPGETIAIIEVDRDYQLALSVAQKIDEKLENGFVTIRQAGGKGSAKASAGKVTGVHDARVAELIRLLNSRSRTSETQPSLRYISDAAERLSLAISARHHLIFGRRGVGKTALLLEAKRVLEVQGAHVLWINMQALRALTASHAFLTIALRLCDLLLGAYVEMKASQASDFLRQLRASIEQRFMASQGSLDEVARFVPRLQQACARFCLQSGSPLFIFLDDIHYLKSDDVPRFLDLMHGVTRDCPVWLKVAGIQHQTRWFIPDPPTGLQTGHDATIISLDVTLEQPERAKEFLEKVLKGYVEECSALPLSNVLSASSIDRLVLASGGVPRDFLTLCAASLQTARQRANAKTVGVQDVNNAAGVAGQTKQQELEDDAAATSGRSVILVGALNVVREFLLSSEQITFFRVGFRDKEVRQGEYRALQALADLRMIHLINGSLSDQHQAGQKSEVYLLDLSQYSGSRLKQNLYVLDFEKGHMVLKRTRSAEAPRTGNTVLKLVSLLRRAPQFELDRLSNLIVPDLDI